MKRFYGYPGLAALAAAADLPVKQVVLYKHGVGFFERSGTLGPGESARLDFNAAEMNDVLKSLTIYRARRRQDLRPALRLHGPAQPQAGRVPLSDRRAQPLSAMLDQLKGARLELKFGAETVAGAIVNGRLVAGTDKQPEREQLTLMLDSGELRTVDLGAATGDPLPRRQAAGAIQGLPGGAGGGALQGQAQRVHRFHATPKSARWWPAT